MQRQEQELRELEEARERREAEAARSDPAKFDEVLSRLFARLTHAEGEAIAQGGVLEAHACLLEELHHHALQRDPSVNPEVLPSLHTKSHFSDQGKPKGKMPKGMPKGKGKGNPARFVYDELDAEAKCIAAQKGIRYFCIACAARTQSQVSAADFNVHCTTPYHRHWRNAEGCPTLPGPYTGSLPSHDRWAMAWEPYDLELATDQYNAEIKRLGVPWLE